MRLVAKVFCGSKAALMRPLLGLQADLVDESLPVVKGRITSVSSRIHRMFTSSAAEPSQHHEP